MCQTRDLHLHDARLTKEFERASETPEMQML